MNTTRGAAILFISIVPSNRTVVLSVSRFTNLLPILATVVEVAAAKAKTTPVAAKAKAAAKKATPTAAAKPATKPSHPSTSEMINAALNTLQDRKGSSLQAIKKYIAGHYVVDVQRLSPFIKKYLKTAVEKNIIVQTAGVGVAGRFKIVKPDAAKKAVAKKTVARPAVRKLPKSPSKAKKSGKAPAAKTKSPKPKKVNAN